MKTLRSPPSILEKGCDETSLGTDTNSDRGDL